MPAAMISRMNAFRMLSAPWSLAGLGSCTVSTVSTASAFTEECRPYFLIFARAMGPPIRLPDTRP